MSILPAICDDLSDDQSSLSCLGYLRQLVSCKAVREVPAQQLIHLQGETIHTAHFICEGLVKVTHTMADGRRMIVALRKGGWLLGVGAIVGEFPYPNTAETLIRSKLCSFPAEQLRQLMETDARFATWVAKILAGGFYASVMKISEKSLLSGRERFEKFIWEIVESITGGEQKNIHQKNIKLRFPLKQCEVAQLISLTPQHLARMITQMEGEGILMRQKGWIILKEPGRLRHPGRLIRG